MQALQFVAPCAPYNTGDIAGFDDVTAATLVGRGVAIVAPRSPKAPGQAPPAAARVALVFLRPCAPYNAGDIAGFDEATAARLVASGAARLHDPAETVATAAATHVATTEAEQLTVVRFLRAHPPYLVGDLASFSPQRAGELCLPARGEPAAEYVSGAKPKRPKRGRAAVDPDAGVGPETVEGVGRLSSPPTPPPPLAPPKA